MSQEVSFQIALTPVLFACMLFDLYILLQVGGTDERRYWLKKARGKLLLSLSHSHFSPLVRLIMVSHQIRDYPAIYMWHGNEEALEKMRHDRSESPLIKLYQKHCHMLSPVCNFGNMLYWTATYQKKHSYKNSWTMIAYCHHHQSAWLPCCSPVSWARRWAH